MKGDGVRGTGRACWSWDYSSLIGTIVDRNGGIVQGRGHGSHRLTTQYKSYYNEFVDLRCSGLSDDTFYPITFILFSDKKYAKVTD